MENIKCGTPTYQKRVKKKPLKCGPHLIEKVAFCQKYIIYLKQIDCKLSSLHSDSIHRTNIKHYGLGG